MSYHLIAEKGKQSIDLGFTDLFELVISVVFNSDQIEHYILQVEQEIQERENDIIKMASWHTGNYTEFEKKIQDIDADLDSTGGFYRLLEDLYLAQRLIENGWKVSKKE